MPKFWWLPWFPENSWYAYTFATQCIVQSCTMQRNWIKNKLWFWIQKGFNPIMDGLQLSSEFETLLTRSVQQMAEMWKEILLRMAKLLRERASRPWHTKLHKMQKASRLCFFCIHKKLLQVFFDRQTLFIVH